MTDENKNEEKNGFEQLAAFFGEVYTVLQAKEDYDIDNELDFRAGLPITTTEIQTRCPECGEHNTKGHQQ